jgi:hypothetical protein
LRKVEGPYRFIHLCLNEGPEILVVGLGQLLPNVWQIFGNGNVVETKELGKAMLPSLAGGAGFLKFIVVLSRCLLGFPSDKFVNTTTNLAGNLGGALEDWLLAEVWKVMLDLSPAGCSEFGMHGCRRRR